MVEIIANLEVDLLFDCLVGVFVPTEDCLKRITPLLTTDLAVRFGDEAIGVGLSKLHDIVIVPLVIFVVRWKRLR